MKLSTRTLLVSTRITLALAASTSLGVLFAERGSDSKGSSAAENRYIGADKCKSCHGSADSGDQYGHWMGTDHAKAFERLASDEAKKVGAQRGAEKPQKNDACLSCHVTAFGLPEDKIKKGFDRSLGVQCESCHGPGEAHVKARFAAAGQGDAPAAYVEVPEDEIVKAPRQDVCKTCHNEASPSFKRFCYHETLAKIRHLNPKKPRDPSSVLVCGCKDPCSCTRGCPDSGCGKPPKQ